MGNYLLFFSRSDTQLLLNASQMIQLFKKMLIKFRI